MLEVGSASFVDFYADAEPKLRFAFAARFGAADGLDAAAEALAYGWEHWDRVQKMDNPVGYLFRVGTSRTRRLRRKTPVLADVPIGGLPDVEPRLPQALASLSEKQRICVTLVSGFGWTHPEVAEVLSVSPTTVETHVRRGLEKLRRKLGGGQ